MMEDYYTVDIKSLEQEDLMIKKRSSPSHSSDGRGKKRGHSDAMREIIDNDVKMTRKYKWI